MKPALCRLTPVAIVLAILHLHHHTQFPTQASIESKSQLQLRSQDQAQSRPQSRPHARAQTLSSPREVSCDSKYARNHNKYGPGYSVGCCSLYRPRFCPRDCRDHRQCLWINPTGPKRASRNSKGPGSSGSIDRVLGLRGGVREKSGPEGGAEEDVEGMEAMRDMWGGGEEDSDSDMMFSGSEAYEDFDDERLVQNVLMDIPPHKLKHKPHQHDNSKHSQPNPTHRPQTQTRTLTQAEYHRGEQQRHHQGDGNQDGIQDLDTLDDNNNYKGPHGPKAYQNWVKNVFPDLRNPNPPPVNWESLVQRQFARYVGEKTKNQTQYEDLGLYGGDRLQIALQSHFLQNDSEEVDDGRKGQGRYGHPAQQPLNTQPNLNPEYSISTPREAARFQIHTSSARVSQPVNTNDPNRPQHTILHSITGQRIIPARATSQRGTGNHEDAEEGDGDGDEHEGSDGEYGDGIGSTFENHGYSNRNVDQFGHVNKNDYRNYHGNGPSERAYADVGGANAGLGSYGGGFGDDHREAELKRSVADRLEKDHVFRDSLREVVQEGLDEYGVSGFNPELLNNTNPKHLMQTLQYLDSLALNESHKDEKLEERESNIPGPQLFRAKTSGDQAATRHSQAERHHQTVINHPNRLDYESMGIQPPWVVTLAGKKGRTGTRDGAPLHARFSGIQDLAIDQEGVIYMCDSDNNRIRTINSQNMACTLCGSLQPGRLDGYLHDCHFDNPMGLCVTGERDIFVADTGNHLVRHISPRGRVYTIAGDKEGYRDGESELAQFRSPASVVFLDSGSLIVSDVGNMCLREITNPLHPSRKSIFRFSAPVSIVHTRRIRYNASRFNVPFSSQSRIPNPLAQRSRSCGGLREFPLDFPAGLAADRSGHLFVAVRWVMHGILKVSLRNWELVGIVGAQDMGHRDGKGSMALFNHPSGICVAEDGSVMVADTGNHCIRRISPTGEVTTHAGIPGKSGADNGKPLLSRFNSPSNLAYCPVTNDIIVADNKNHLLRRILRERVGMSE
ncbi:hypothetical protein AAMO2058_001558100 [Amorphochlora amoebiformis]